MIIELHAIQSFAPANLNRDDTGAPKEATFGGVRRARVSSQAWKRAIRDHFRRAEPVRTATRTKRAHDEIVGRLVARGTPRERAEHRAAVVLEAEPLSLGLKRVGDDGEVKTGQLLFFRDSDLDLLAEVADEFGAELDALPSALAEGTGKKGAKKPLPRQAEAKVRRALTSPADAVDVALFGRMVAELPEANVDAACQVAHAIGTHRLASEFDYYTAVDDLKPSDTEGADMIGTVQFNASCLYRYAALDTGQLAANLGAAAGEDARRVAVAAFARAFTLAAPTGKQNSFAARNPPFAVLGVCRENGAWNLANAFLEPVDAAAAPDGLAAESTRHMLREFATLEAMYGSGDAQLDALLLAPPVVADSTALRRVAHLDELIGELERRA